MATRRTTAPRKRPNAKASGEGVSVPRPRSFENAAKAPPAEAEPLEIDLVAEFSAALAQQEGLDKESQTFIVEQFQQAVQEASEDPASKPPDRAEWIHVIELLQQSGELAEDETNTLIRQLDAALRPLEGREARLALEFNRRCQEEGEDSALAWFRSQLGKDDRQADDDKADLGTTTNGFAKNSITKSRSRRLRGPPS